MVDPEYYVNGEDANIGKKTVPREHLDAKLALVKPGYDAAVLVGNYKNMAERESEIIEMVLSCRGYFARPEIIEMD